MKRCPKCHKLNVSQAKFCKNCGYTFKSQKNGKHTDLDHELSLDSFHRQGYHVVHTKFYDFKSAVRDFWKRGFEDFFGYSNRSQYWFAYLFVMAARFLLSFCMLALTSTNLFTNFDIALNNGSGPLGMVGLVSFGGVFGILIVLFELAVLIPDISIRVRRYHDAGMPHYLGLAIATVICDYIPIISTLSFIANIIICCLPSVRPNHPNDDTPAHTNLKQTATLNAEAHAQTPVVPHITPHQASQAPRASSTGQTMHSSAK